jgi:hypothetical protein
MKKYLVLLSICFGISAFAFSQSVGIGTTVPNGSAQLDITSAAKGILIPRMNSAAINAISNPAKGLMVYDSSKNQLMVNMGTAAIPNWQTIVSKSGWNLNGNSGTNPATNFIGTVDVSPLLIKVNNVKAGYIDSGTNNTGIGFRTLDSITIGTDNLALGYKALVANSIGGSNTAVGSNALSGNNGGSYNTGTGTGSLSQNSAGNLNSAFGALSLNRNIDGSRNTAIGTSSSYWNNADNNTSVGFESLNQNTTGASNTAVGTSALWNNTLGYSNVAIGVRSLYHNTYTSNLVAVGDSSLFNNGIGAIQFYLQGTSNTAIGSKSLLSNTTGSANTANGYQSLYSNTSGDANTAEGWNSLSRNISGGENIALGVQALEGNISGQYNTGVGARALQNSNGSDYNTAVGWQAGLAHLGNNNTFIGARCGVTMVGLYNCVGLGEETLCTANNQARIGNSSTTSIGGQVGWSTLSDGRYKKNIQENVKGIDFIMKLHPVTYQLDVQGISNKLNESRGREIDPQIKVSIAEKEKIIFSGFVAQDVEKAARESGYDFSGVDAPKNKNDFYGLRYGDFVVPLVKTVQEQQVIIEGQRVQLAEQKNINNNQQAMNNDLLKRVQSLEDQLKLLLQSASHKNH